MQFIASIFQTPCKIRVSPRKIYHFFITKVIDMASDFHYFTTDKHKIKKGLTLDFSILTAFFHCNGPNRKFWLCRPLRLEFDPPRSCTSKPHDFNGHGVFLCSFHYSPLQSGLWFSAPSAVALQLRHLKIRNHFYVCLFLNGKSNFVPFSVFTWFST